MLNSNLFPQEISARDIFEARKQDISKALELAEKAYALRPKDTWIQRAYGWVLYDHSKLNFQKKYYDLANEFYNKFASLELPETEDNELLNKNFKKLHQKIDYYLGNIDSNEFLKIIKKEIIEQLKTDIEKNKEDILWKIIDFLKYSSNSKIFDIGFINQIIGNYQKLNPEKPSRIHSLFYYYINELVKSDVKGLNFDLITDILNPPEDFSPDDFKESNKDGKKIMSYAEIFIYSYIKMLLNVSEKSKVKNFIHKIDSLIIKYPNYIWLNFYKCKLLINVSSDKNDILNSIISFIKLKPKEFWTWSLLGDQLKSEPLKAISCYCKAITVSNQEKYISKVRQNLAKLLIENKKYSEAKYEIEKIIQIKKSENQNIPSEINNWINSDWFKNTEAVSSNQSFYNENLKIAEDIVFGNSIIIGVGIITNIDKTSSKANFIVNRNIAGGFKLKKNFQPKIGDIFEFKLLLKEINGNKIYEVVEYHKTKELPSKDVYKEFEGAIKLSKSKEVGFVDTILITRNFIESNNLHNNNIVKGIAIYSFNKKRNEFGWKAIKVWK